MSRVVLPIRATWLAILSAHPKPLFSFSPSTTSIAPVTKWKGVALLSTFTPPNPPETSGSPVFFDIDFTTVSELTSESFKRNQDPNAVFVVTGASRGIGLQFVKTLAARTKGKIVGCCRTPESASSLIKFATTLDDPSRVHLIPMDLEIQSSVEDAARQIMQQFNRVDLLLNVAGLLGDGKTTAGPEKALNQIDRDWFEKTLSVNLIGPVMFAQALLPLMIQKRRPKVAGTQERPVAVIANLSARVGSISDNSLGGWYSYRISKAGLNQATRTMALELKRSAVWVVSLHPGTTDTDLSKPFQGNVAEGKLFPVDFTVDRLLSVIDSMTEEHSGGFYDWAGKAISF